MGWLQRIAGGDVTEGQALHTLLDSASTDEARAQAVEALNYATGGKFSAEDYTSGWGKFRDNLMRDAVFYQDLIDRTNLPQDSLDAANINMLPQFQKTYDDIVAGKGRWGKDFDEIVGTADISGAPWIRELLRRKGHESKGFRQNVEAAQDWMRDSWILSPFSHGVRRSRGQGVTDMYSDPEFLNTQLSGYGKNLRNDAIRGAVTDAALTGVGGIGGTRLVGEGLKRLPGAAKLGDDVVRFAGSDRLNNIENALALADVGLLGAGIDAPIPSVLVGASPNLRRAREGFKRKAKSKMDWGTKNFQATMDLGQGIGQPLGMTRAQAKPYLPTAVSGYTERPMMDKMWDRTSPFLQKLNKHKWPLLAAGAGLVGLGGLAGMAWNGLRGKPKPPAPQPEEEYQDEIGQSQTKSIF
jgi:hypothetical protein